jgi:hypothetical protein
MQQIDNIKEGGTFSTNLQWNQNNAKQQSGWVQENDQQTTLRKYLGCSTGNNQQPTVRIQYMKGDDLSSIRI